MIFWFYFETDDSPAQFAADSAGAHNVEMTLDRGTALPLSLMNTFTCATIQKYTQMQVPTTLKAENQLVIISMDII